MSRKTNYAYGYSVSHFPLQRGMITTIYFANNVYASKRFSRETVELSIVQILVLVARSLTEIIIGDDRSGERFHVAA